MLPYQGTKFILTIKIYFHGKLHRKTQYDPPETTGLLGVYKHKHEQW